MTAENPNLKITIEGKEHELTPDNTHLFRYLGEKAIYNHIYMMLRDGDEEQGVYLFQSSFVGEDDSPFSEILHHMLKHNFPIHLNQPEISPLDEQAFRNRFQADLDSNDSFPEGWEQEAA